MFKGFYMAVVALFIATAAFCASPAVRDIDIRVDLAPDGTATVVETWDVTVASGTEWYLVRDNLGSVRIYDLSVADETGKVFVNEGAWDVDRSIREKEGRCGIVQKSDGVELCWGVGSYGDHVYRVSYRMSNAVDGYDDYDCFHFQLVSPGLSSAPQHVSVQLTAPCALSTENSRIWGFGFGGTTGFDEGCAWMESSQSLRRDDSVILLLRFNKGIFTPSAVRSGSFDEMVLDRAMNGADFGDGDEDDFKDFITFLVTSVTVFLGIVGLGTYAEKRRRRKILGCDPKDVQWSREVPLGGDIYKTYYLLRDLGAVKSNANLASAAVLRMVYDGTIDVRKNDRDQVELCFSRPLPDGTDPNSAALYKYIKEAAGSDGILQKNEFTRWGTKNYPLLNSWNQNVVNAGARSLAESGYRKGTESGQKIAREALGFKKFLDDFTLIGERSTPEVGLWQEYLIFGALFGIASQVAKELKEINPSMFEAMSSGRQFQTYDMVDMVARLNRSMRVSESRYQSTQASKGMGGGTSFGGGGGFHGGGFGGGSR